MRALITGAGAPGGIGLASTRALGQAGAELVITSTTGRIFARAAELTAEGHRVTAHQADLLFAKVALEGRKGRRLAA
jgi:3-oxoacyl-[acyl-carrier protein] reductase